MLESPMDADHLSNAVLIGIDLQQILWMPNVTLLAVRKLQDGLKPYILFVKTLLNTNISSFPFAATEVVKL